MKMTKKLTVLFMVLMMSISAVFAKSVNTSQMFIENNTGNTIAVVASNDNGDLLWGNGYIIVSDGEAIVVEVDYTTKEPTQLLAVVFDFDPSTGVGHCGCWTGIQVLSNGTISFTYEEKGPSIQKKVPLAVNGQRVFKF
jgi:Ethanolamine utilization protein EutJ (predicted chaperonin)